MLDSSHKTIATGVVLKVEKGLHAFGVDEAAGARVALWQIAFSGWVTLSARKWVISRERRGTLRENEPILKANVLDNIRPSAHIKCEQRFGKTTVFPNSAARGLIRHK